MTQAQRKYSMYSIRTALSKCYQEVSLFRYDTGCDSECVSIWHCVNSKNTDGTYYPWHTPSIPYKQESKVYFHPVYFDIDISESFEKNVVSFMSRSQKQIISEQDKFFFKLHSVRMNMLKASKTMQNNAISLPINYFVMRHHDIFRICTAACFALGTQYNMNIPFMDHREKEQKSSMSVIQTRVLLLVSNHWKTQTTWRHYNIEIYNNGDSYSSDSENRLLRPTCIDIGSFEAE